MPELYLPGKNGFAQKPAAKPIVSTTFQQARELQVLTITNDQTQQVEGAAIAFPHEGMAYALKDVQQLAHIGRALLEVASMIRANAFKPVIRKS